MQLFSGSKFAINSFQKISFNLDLMVFNGRRDSGRMVGESSIGVVAC